MNDKNFNSYLQTVNSNSPATKKGVSPKKDAGNGAQGSTTKPQPRFIRKKPQVIQSIEFCKELKTSYMDDFQNTPSQAAQMSPGKVKVPSENNETPPQLRSSMMYHQQKGGDDLSHHEVIDYDEELMHAQVPQLLNQEENQHNQHEILGYRTYGGDAEEEYETSERPQQLFQIPQQSVIQEVTEYSSAPLADNQERKQLVTGYTYSLNNTSQAMNITDQQPSSQGAHDELDLIKKMMDDLRMKKQQELEKLMQVKPIFTVESSDQADSEQYRSDPKSLQQHQNTNPQNRRSKQERSKERKSPERPLKQENQHKRGNDLEDLKKRKIQEIKSKLINERSQGGAIKPYNPPQNLKIEEEYKSEKSNSLNSKDSSNYRKAPPSAKLDKKGGPGHQMITRPKTAYPSTNQGSQNEQSSNEQRKIALKAAIQQKAQQQTRNFQQFQNSQFSSQTVAYGQDVAVNKGSDRVYKSGYELKPSHLYTTMQPSDEKSSLAPRKSPRSTSPVPASALSVQQAAHHTLNALAPHLVLSPQQQQIQESYRVHNQLVSEKTQQIVFKKLQKEVELAIRNQDQGEKGGLNMEELKKCLYSLDYLGYMQVEEEEQMQLQNLRKLYNGQNNIRHHVTTKRSLVMQEKEFVYNFWCIINPLNQTEVDNALLYDILLLLVYNVQQPLYVTINYLTEYLDNHYREQGIDLDSFTTYNTTNSKGTEESPDHPIQRNEELSNVSKYLSYCNLWPIERLTYEFRQIHANKLSHQFSSNTSKKRSSVSPLGSTDGSQNLNNQILINPTDGRRYKKVVIEDHLQNLTFSPQISNKTKQLDQRLTQKLLHTKLSPDLKRDYSADTLPHHQNVASSNFTLNLEPVQHHLQNPLVENNNNNSISPNMKRYELLLFRQQMTKQKIEKAKENKQIKQLEECTFHPKLSTENSLIQGGSHNGTLQSSKSYQNLQKQANSIFRDLAEKVKTQKSRLFDHTEASKAMACHTAAILKDEKELEECTFKPKINRPISQQQQQQNRTPKRQENESNTANQVPKGYYQMVNRMRKVNEERKALEEKIHKKVIGENYDKVKLMNLKPPSFIQGQAEKKKRKLLMYIDVNITPTRTGRIGIYEGDDVRELAKNFQKTFQLNNNMLLLLTQQLDQHLQVYKERNGMSDVQGTIFPPEKEENYDQLNVPDGIYINGQQSIQPINPFNQMRQEEELKSSSELIRPQEQKNKQINFLPLTSQRDGTSPFSPFGQELTDKRTHYNQHSNPNFFVSDDDSPRQGFQHVSGQVQRDGFQRYSQKASGLTGVGRQSNGGRRTGENLSRNQESMGTSTDRTRIAGPDQPGFFGIPLNDINIQQLTQRNTLKNSGAAERNDTFY